jgi:hypothetical protein
MYRIEQSIRAVLRNTFLSGGPMSARNGDRARFQKDRKRKLRLRQRIQALRVALRERATAKPETPIPVVTANQS